MNLSYHPGAMKDVRDSFKWYAQDSPETALRFLDSLDGGYERIAAHPMRFPVYSRNT